MDAFEAPDVSLALFCHLKQYLARPLVCQGSSQAAALLDPSPHPRDHLKIIFSHAASNSHRLVRFLRFRLRSYFRG